ncbi:MAG: HAMP domain-containing histidine kinase [Propionibacteriaceae bacterium]|nr:HAMP domain-containing histidine kinase [Propionibacteriaceae bacterium]
MTLRNRVALIAAAIVLAVVVAVNIVLVYAYSGQLRSGGDASLVDAAQQASTIAAKMKATEANQPSAAPTKPTPPPSTSPKPTPDKPPSDTDTIVTVGAIQVELLWGPVIAGEPSLLGPLTTQDVAVSLGSRPAYFGYSPDQTLRTYTAALTGVPGGGLVRATRKLSADSDALHQAEWLLAALALAATGVTYLALRLAAGRILRPIRRLTSTAEQITKTRDLSARIDAGTSGDEVTRLGSAFNTMLIALDESVTAQRQLVADASHELRTPLTSLTTNLDLLEDGDGLADPQAPALVAAAREQAGELNELIADLLDLSRYQEAEPHRAVVRLDNLTQEAVDQIRRRTPEPVIEVNLEPCLVDVDAAAVHRAIVNLIDNAIKWSPPGAAVRVVVEDGRVTVADSGPGISDEDMPHVFERFYRAPAARGRPGTGLGLAIVASVAAANDATASATTSSDGSVFTLGFAPVPAES